MADGKDAAAIRPRLHVGVIDLEAQRPNFARIAKVAKALFGVYVCDVMVVHKDFLWSSREEAMTQGEATPAIQAAAGDGVYWLEDASRDPEWANHRVVAGPPHVRFYAAAPIILADGLRLGVLAVMHNVPMAWDEELAARLADLADIIASECDRERERQVLIRTEQRLNMAVKLGQLHVWEMDYAGGKLEKMGAEDSFYETPVTYQNLIDDPFYGVHRDDLAMIHASWENRKPGVRPPPVEMRVRRFDGQTVWASCSTRPIFDSEGRNVRTIGVMQNITDRKQAELELIATRDKAEAANRAKSTFLANMSHELRTPLNGVTGVAGALAQTSLTDGQKEMVSIIETSARTLNTLVSDLLDLSSLEQGRVEIRPEPFDLMESIRACTSPFTGPALAKGLAFEVDVAEEAHGQWLGDANRIRQVLMHLLSNAVKFTEQGSVRLSVRPHERGLSFAVRDTGIGFDALAKARLFQQFEQADGASTRRYGGAGLGLALSQALAKAMDASLEAESAPSVGSLFTFTLDCPRIENDPTEIDSGTDEPPAMRVLVAEDHATNRKVVEIMLNAFGVDLTFAENGQEAVDSFRMSRFDLIFMDMQMPVMDGLTAIRAIRGIEAKEERKRTPIYTLTANAMPEHAKASFDAGSDGHVTKPVTSETLLGVLIAACQGEEAVEAEPDAPANAA